MISVTAKHPKMSIHVNFQVLKFRVLTFNTSSKIQQFNWYQYTLRTRDKLKNTTTVMK